MNPLRLHKETISSILACSYAWSFTMGLLMTEAVVVVAVVVVVAADAAANDDDDDDDDSSVVENKRKLVRAMEAFGGTRPMATLDSNAIDMDMLVKKVAEIFILSMNACDLPMRCDLM